MMQLSRWAHSASLGKAMDKRMPSSVGIATAILLLVSVGAIAQTPPWAVGTWKGAISNLRNDPSGPERVLIIGADGTCKWDLRRK